MEVARKLLIIYYNNPNCLKKVSILGNLIYQSKKLCYAYLYVDEKNAKSIIENIKQINGVTKVEVSLTEVEEYAFKI
ncbi:MAG: hypothetical protein K0Q49_1090 [Haloplasmataceae bacterium]|jgi:uncharacterized protein YlbG (UPF0298 family)|nr:hypothetical protein [Haloplasmataceae bacterium]